MVRLIAAIDGHRGLAGQHGIPWQGRIPADTSYFREQTAQGMIVMGYRTYEEFDVPLHDRSNFVVARSAASPLRPGFVAIGDLIEFLHQYASDLVWVIGGAAVFAQALPLADELHITQLEGDFHCTKFFPVFEDEFVLTTELGPQVQNDISFRTQIWGRAPTA
jgi:dihydrofolate reductase